MFVLRHIPSGKFERYTYDYSTPIGVDGGLTDNINEAKTYGAETSCRNSSAWKLEDYEYVEVQVSVTTRTITSNKK